MFIFLTKVQKYRGPATSVKNHDADLNMLLGESNYVYVTTVVRQCLMGDLLCSWG